jgi:hypothetical protein
MNTLKQWWAWYLCLPTWKQALFFIPLVIGGVVYFVLALPSTITSTPSKKPIDNMLDARQRRDDLAAEKADQITAKIKEIDARIGEQDAQAQETLARIDAASGDGLSKVAAELRAKHAGIIATSTSRKSGDNK